MSIIATVEQLEAIYGQPNEASTVKVSAKITPPYRALIDKSPFAALATCGLEGLDCSPRGDVSGFVRVHDEKTLTMLDRRGSRRTESLWLRTTVFAKDGLPVAKMLLNLASLKDSYAPYAQEYDQLYAQGA